jgi:hypothetical protein
MNLCYNKIKEKVGDNLENRIETSKTITNEKGEIIFFGLQHFLNDIVKGNCCFICGAEPESKEFNDEHIISDWILRKYNLHDKYITLPNGTKFRYDQYTVPCCKECNSELGKTYEEPISDLFSKSYSEILEEINKDPNIAQFLFKWLSLIFLKTHLKDKTLLTERDRRINAGFLSDKYYWEEMHHLHCIARSHYTNAKIDYNVSGTIFIVPALVINGSDGFDFMDNEISKTIMLQLGEFCIICVLNDSCAGFTLYNDNFSKIKGPLSPFQIRDVFAHLSFINLNLKERPIYFSRFIHSLDEYQIKVTLPKFVELLDEDERVITSGKLLRQFVEPMIGEIENKEQILKEIEENRRNYLFDNDGNFIKNEL